MAVPQELSEAAASLPPRTGGSMNKLFLDLDLLDLWINHFGFDLVKRLYLRALEILSVSVKMTTWRLL